MIARLHDSPFWSKPIMLWLVHIAPLLWLLSAITVPLVRYVAGPWAAPSAVVTILLMIVLGFASFGEWAHDVQMCPRCAANMPLNTTRMARVVKSFLWLHHAAVYVGVALFVLLVWVTLSPPPQAVSTGLNIALSVLFAAQVQAMLVHRAHRPWCPYCDGGWGDDPDAPAEPVLDPTPPGKTTTV